jgi:hypothetical protein
VIGYLEQLERDLVEAIDRREPHGTTQRVIRRGRPRMRTVAIALAALLAGVAIGIAIHAARDQGREIPAEPPKPTIAPTPTPPPNAGSPAHLRFVGELVADGTRAWRGVAAGVGVRAGKLTISGPVEFRNRAEHVIRFEWVIPGGSIAGCISNTMYRRPGGRWVWDGVGHITAATGRLARWRRTFAGIAGRTYVSDMGHARIIIGGGEGMTPKEVRRSGAFDC